MSWTKVFTALKGLVAETGENIADGQQLRILDQERRELRTNLEKAKQGLTTIVAKRMGAERRVGEIKQSISEYEGYAMQALEAGKQDLAEEAATKVANLESDLQAEEAALGEFQVSEKNLRDTVGEIERTLTTIDRQSEIVKATEAAHKAQAHTVSNVHGAKSSLSKTSETLAAIKKRQQEDSDRFKAAQEMAAASSGEDLKSKLAAAGIGGSASNASSVLERLRAQKKGA